MLPKWIIEGIALDLHKHGIIQLFKAPRRLASGLTSGVYLNMDLVPQDKMFCANFKEQVEDFLGVRSFNGFGLVCPVPFGGRPWIELVQSCLPTKLPSLLLDREQIKEFCKSGCAFLTVDQKEVIAQISNNEKRVIVIEDVFTTGGSVAKTLRFLQAWKFDPLVIAVLDRQRSRSEDFKRLGIEFFSFLNIREILQPLINIPQILNLEEKSIANAELSLLD